MSIKLDKGQLSIVISQEHKQDKKFKVNINSKIKTLLELTQSSRINIQAKLQSTPTSFKPQFFSFRLKNKQYENITQPVLVKYDSNEQTYKVTIDLGDPVSYFIIFKQIQKQIKPFSDKYQLQVIIADQNLDKNIRNIIADCDIKFRKSLQSIPLSQLHYKTQNIIETSKPAERIDPPKIFTIFIVIMILVFNGIFLYGLSYLKVNVNLFPKSSSGFLMNIGFIVIFMANLAILMKFWINWTFLETLQYLLIILLPTALIANYAFIYIKKQ